MPHLVSSAEEIPEIHIEDMAMGIEGASRDRVTWNEMVHKSDLNAPTKLWLIVP